MGRSDGIEDDDALDRAVTHEAATRGPRPKLDDQPRAINLAEVRAAAARDGAPLPGAEKCVSKRLQEETDRALHPQQPAHGLHGHGPWLPQYAPQPQSDHHMRGMYPERYPQPAPAAPLPPGVEAKLPYYGQMQQAPPMFQQMPSPAHYAEEFQRQRQAELQQAFEQGRQYERARLRAMLEQP